MVAITTSNGDYRRQVAL